MALGSWELTASDALRVLVRPHETYAAAVHARRSDSLWTAVRRPLFVALIQGVAISMVATHSVAAPLVVSVAASWAILVAAQVAGALLLIRSAAAPRVGASGALDLFFLGHAPWSLWLLVSAGVMTVASTLTILRWLAIVSMIVPAALTSRIVAAFDEAVLGSSRRSAVRRTMLHQGLMWAALVLYIAASIQLWPRAIGVFRP